jgi:hypothetical protein
MRILAKRLSDVLPEGFGVRCIGSGPTLCYVRDSGDEGDDRYCLTHEHARWVSDLQNALDDVELRDLAEGHLRLIGWL